MKKNIADTLRRIAQWLDPQKPEVTGYARKVIDFIPYNGIDIYRTQLLSGCEDQAKNLRYSMKILAETMAQGNYRDKLEMGGIVKFEHNFGTKGKTVDGITCKPSGLTVIMELKGSWS